MVSDKLLNDVKNYLDKTWELSDAEKAKLTGMIERGMRMLEDKIGTCDFEGETQEKSLLLCYVMYENSGALDDFFRNYQEQIISLQIDRWVNKNAANQGETI